ncbi:MAG: flagellar basal body rod C-terminal domain-containing protein, partial [Thermoguttaceae bacterium]
EIRTLNIRIADVEGGDLSASDAVGLRDRRLMALEKLAELVDIRVKEQPNSTVVVYLGGDFLVFGGISQEVEVVFDSDRGLTIANIHFAVTDSPINPAAGELRGLLDTRDDVMAGFLDSLDDFSRTLGFEFNKLYSGGQGLSGFQEMTSEFAVDDVDEPLDQVGLEFTPVNGSFQIMVRSKETGQTNTTDILVDLNGLGDDMTLNEPDSDSLVAALNAIDGITATVTSDRRLTIRSDSPDSEFAFGDDTSGLLAALGLNTFFTGTSARNIGVNAQLEADPAKFAASRGGIGADTENAVDLAVFLDRPIESQNNASLAVLYDSLISENTQAAAISRAVADGARAFEQTLRGQKVATSGVSLDEEAIRLMAFQRSYQASARYIAVLNELFGILVNL